MLLLLHLHRQRRQRRQRHPRHPHHPHQLQHPQHLQRQPPTEAMEQSVDHKVLGTTWEPRRSLLDANGWTALPLLLPRTIPPLLPKNPARQSPTAATELVWAACVDAFLTCRPQARIARTKARTTTMPTAPRSIRTYQATATPFLLSSVVLAVAAPLQSQRRVQMGPTASRGEALLGRIVPRAATMARQEVVV